MSPVPKKLMWTQLQKEVALLLQQEKTFSEIIDAGYSKNMIGRVHRALKRGEAPSIKEESQKDDNGAKPPAKGSSRGSLEIGKIVVTPENWGISQYGAVLILDTYTHAKNDEEFKYEGTVGQFLCDVMLIWRKMMGYEEVYYDPRTEESGWIGSSQEDGGEDVEPREPVESAA